MFLLSDNYGGFNKNKFMVKVRKEIILEVEPKSHELEANNYCLCSAPLNIVICIIPGHTSVPTHNQTAKR